MGHAFYQSADKSAATMNDSREHSIIAGDEIKTVDHLSEMPDDILSCILSSFSMRDAVKLRILSSRWRARTFSSHRGTCDKFYDFPCQLLPFDNTSQLKHLCLKSCKFRPSPDLTDRLSSLKTLDLFHARLDQRDVQSILSGCSNLEWLRLKKSILPVTLCIHGLPHLKVFIMHDCIGVEKIELSSVGLTTLEYIGRVQSFSFVDLPRLEKVHIRFLHGFQKARDYIFYRLANDLPQLQSLSLILPTEEYLPVPASMPMFNCLKQLELFVFVSSDFKLISLSSFLNASPRLQKLQLMLHRGRDGFSREEVVYPKCIHFELKEVEIFGFRGNSNELELALYLLDNAFSLERMILTPRRILYHGSGKWTGNLPIPFPWEGKILKKAYDLLKERANPRVEIVLLSA